MGRAATEKFSRPGAPRFQKGGCFMEQYKHSFKLERRIASLAVQNTGRQQCSPGYCWGPGVRDHYLIHHVLRGHGNLVIGDKHFTLGPGDTFLTYPDISILYYADQENPWEYVWVGFQGVEAEGLVEQTDFTPDNPVLYGYCSAEIAGLLTDLYQDYGTAAWCRPAITGRLYLLLSFLMRHSQRIWKSTVSGRDCANTAATYVMSHYEQPITVEDLADFVSVSPSSLYRSFKARFNVSPKHFIIEYRIERACVLLDKGGLSVREVSNSVGFDDPFHFSRAFKEIKGVSPKTYMERRRKEKEGL